MKEIGFSKSMIDFLVVLFDLASLNCNKEESNILFNIE